MKRTLTTLALIVLTTLAALALTGCDEKQIQSYCKIVGNCK